jgi:hypothetical protein
MLGRTSAMATQYENAIYFCSLTFQVTFRALFVVAHPHGAHNQSYHEARGAPQSPVTRGSDVSCTRNMKPGAVRKEMSCVDCHSFPYL